VSLLRRLLGGDRNAGPGSDGGPEAQRPATAAEVEAAELEHEREMLRAEAERLDELRQRQLRYQLHSWTPPAQGGERRADDEDGQGE
jgi:hypothetical protein